MTATAQAMDRITDGMDRGLAIYKTAQEWGLTPEVLSKRLRGSRRPMTKRQDTTGEEQWWQK